MRGQVDGPPVRPGCGCASGCCGWSPWTSSGRAAPQPLAGTLQIAAARSVGSVTIGSPRRERYASWKAGFKKAGSDGRNVKLFSSNSETARAAHSRRHRMHQQMEPGPPVLSYLPVRQPGLEYSSIHVWRINWCRFAWKRAIIGLCRPPSQAPSRLLFPCNWSRLA